MSVVDEIKGKLDIVTYIQQYATLKRAGRYYKACCPFHSEKTPSFVVNPDNQTWRCFGACAEGGDVFSFAMKQHGWSFNEALQELGRMVGVEARPQSPQQKQHNDQLDTLRGLLTSAAEFYHRQLLDSSVGAATLAYARQKRGFSDETIQRFQIGYAPQGWQHLLNELKQLGYSEQQALDAGVASKNDAGKVYDRFRNRLMIPIRDERGRVIGFGARALAADDNPKYLNSPQSVMFDKSKTLFGLDTAKRTIRETETAVIVEGYMDAIQAQQAGFHNVVAQMGTALTETQLGLIAPRYAKKIILALDADAAGQNATMRSLEVARQALQADYAGRMSVDIRILQIPGAKDPDDLIRESPDKWSELVAHALPVSDFVIAMETASLPPNATVQEREQVARRVLPMLLASENDLYKQDNLQKLALRLRIPERELLRWADDQRQHDARQPRKPALPAAPSADPDTDSDAPYMPPLDYDALLPPDELPDDHTLVLGDAKGVQPSYQTSPAKLLAAKLRSTGNGNGAAKSDYALERYCLRLLLMQPDTLYTVNRKFRELAKDNATLIKGLLGELCVDDFQDNLHRVLMQHFVMALQQDDYDILAYIRDQLTLTDAHLLAELDQLFVEEADSVRQRIRGRFDGDAIVSWRQHERRKVGMVDPMAELLDKVLRLRLQRVQRDTQELQFLQLEAQQSSQQPAHQHQPDADTADSLYIQQIIAAMQAKRSIEGELQQLSKYFV